MTQQTMLYESPVPYEFMVRRVVIGGDKCRMEFWSQNNCVSVPEELWLDALATMQRRGFI